LITKNRLMTYSTAFAVMFTIAIATTQTTHATDWIWRPHVPSNLEVPAGNRLFLAGHAIGTQNYICAPSASGPKWLFIGPQATIFNHDYQQILTHFQSKNPFQADAIQATWQHSRDTSAVWAKKKFGSTDPAFVSPDAIEWLLLEVTGTKEGPSGGDRLANTTFIQRVHTVGGKEPTIPCTETIYNQRELVNYEADYYFYTSHGGRD
jgi:hypothetical protein